MCRLPAIQRREASSGSFPIRRMRTPDPKPNRLRAARPRSPNVVSANLIPKQKRKDAQFLSCASLAGPKTLLHDLSSLASIRRSIGSSTDVLCTSSANEDRQCHSPTCHETKSEVCFPHSYLLGLLCVGYGTVLVVSGNLTQQSDGSLCLLNLLIRQAD